MMLHHCGRGAHCLVLRRMDGLLQILLRVVDLILLDTWRVEKVLSLGRVFDLNGVSALLVLSDTPAPIDFVSALK